MLGVYDYTVILTYISVLSASTGIFVTLTGQGHPYLGMVFLLLSGLCDTFDGKVARSKKNRTQLQKDFGVQIDSLSDLVAFGVLPVCLGMALWRRAPKEAGVFDFGRDALLAHIPMWAIYIVCIFFVLAALIRLAYFNVTCEETQGEGMNRNKFYYGLPVTSTALIFPTFLIIRYTVADLWHYDISHFYFVLLIIVGILFISRFKITKPSNVWIYLMVALGAVEFIILLFFNGLQKDIWDYVGSFFRFFAR